MSVQSHQEDLYHEREELYRAIAQLRLHGAAHTEIVAAGDGDWLGARMPLSDRARREIHQQAVDDLRAQVADLESRMAGPQTA